ncbi:MAG: alpha/beta fold hydrolase [Tepidisphaeraceae bacterium]
MSIPRALAETPIHVRFEQMVAKFAGRLAIQGRGVTLTYEQLNDRANRIARELLAQTGRTDLAGQTVGLVIDQGAPLAAAILGTLKAGGAFVPLDPTYPDARLTMMVEDAAPTVIVTDDRRADIARRVACAIPVVNVDHTSPLVTATGNLNLPIEGTRLAYVLFTSGSTGRPKGVMHEHRSVVHNMHRHRVLYGITENDRQTLLYPCSVYGGIRDTFNALLNGASLHHYPLRDAGHAGLADWLDRHAITMYCSVATVFRHFARDLKGRDLLPSLRLIKLGGEAPYRRDVELFQEHFCKHTVMFCGLGATETGVTRQYKIHRDDVLAPGTGVPLGYAVPDIDILLLDAQKKPVPTGEIGEIVIRSRYITTGYRGLDELNTKVFQRDQDDADSRLYFTGDLGKLDGEGCLTHKGRKDQQVKIRGNRVELTEIEQALGGCDGILDAAVIAKLGDGSDAEPDAKLIAYVVPREGMAVPSPKTLREQLLKRLPSFMVPHAFITIDDIPLTPNGKVDRKALPNPDEALKALRGTSDEVSTDDLERKIAELVGKVLRVENVGPGDDFFDLGGDSLSVVKLVLEVEKATGQTLPISSFYESPTPRRLTHCIRQRARGVSDDHSEVVTLRGEGDLPPLICLPGRGGTSFTYRALVDLLEPGRPVYGLQYPGLSGRDEPIPDVTKLATEMIRRVRKVRPCGPWALLGYSYGGLVAFEMARQLRTAGEAVPYLGLIDTTAPGAIVKRPRHERLLLHVRRFFEKSPKAKAQYLSDRWRRLTRRWRHKGPKRGDVLPIQDEALPFIGAQGEVAQWLRALRKAADVARANYKPALADVRVHLFKTASKPDWLDFCEIEPTYGWTALSRNGVASYDIPGRHEQVFHATHVPFLAEQVRASLRASKLCTPGSGQHAA